MAAAVERTRLRVERHFGPCDAQYASPRQRADQPAARLVELASAAEPAAAQRGEVGIRRVVDLVRREPWPGGGESTRHQPPQQVSIQLELEETPPGEALLDRGQQLPGRRPQPAPGRASIVLAEPGGAHRVAMPPDAAVAIGATDVVRAHQRSGLAEHGGTAEVMQRGVSARRAQAQRCHRHARVDAGEHGRVPVDGASVAVEQRAADQEVG